MFDAISTVLGALPRGVPLPPGLDPNPVAPDGPLGKAVVMALGVMKWGGLVGAVGALIAGGIMMAVGRRNRNNLAVEGALSVPWVIGGLALILGASSLVGFFIQ
jgi:hypothetical protein